MDVVLLTPDGAKDWHHFVEDSDQASLVHTLGWRNVVEKTYHHIPYYLMAREGESVTGILPLFLVRSRIFGRFLATAPYLSYGGLLVDEEESARALVEAAKELASEKEASYVEFRGLQKIGHGLRLKEKYCTYFLPLNPNPDAVWGRVKRWTRWAVRKAMKSGLTVEWGAHLVTELAEVLNRVTRDLGTPFHGVSFYRNILEEFPQRAEVFIVRYRQGFIGGGLTLTFRETLTWVYGGCLKAYRDMATMSLLTWEIIRNGCEKGFKYFDFGRSRWDSGTALFKRQWGAQPSPLFYEYYLPGGGSLPDQDPTNPKFRLAIALWKRLPVFAAKALGPFIVRDIP